MDGLGAFLGKICMPVAEEIGLYFQDKVKAWRANNATEIGKRAEKLVDANGGIEGKSIRPLLAWKIIENGSFADSSELQDAWAGLLMLRRCVSGWMELIVRFFLWHYKNRPGFR